MCSSAAAGCRVQTFYRTIPGRLHNVISAGDSRTGMRFPLVQNYNTFVFNIMADLTAREWGYRRDDGHGGEFPGHASDQVEEQDQEDVQDKVAFELWRGR